MKKTFLCIGLGLVLSSFTLTACSSPAEIVAYEVGETATILYAEFNATVQAIEADATERAAKQAAVIPPTSAPDPTQTPTQAPTQTPVPAPTATPQPESADTLSPPDMEPPFASEEFDIEATFELWNFSDEAISMTVENEQILVTIIDTDWSSINWWGDTFEDIALSIDAKQLDGRDGDGNFGLVCRSVDIDNMYTFDITNDGWYSISKLKDQEWTFLVPYTESSAINQGDAWNTIQVTCVGDTLSMWVNGTFLASVVDSDLKEGDVAFSAVAFSVPNTSFVFDNFKLANP